MWRSRRVVKEYLVAAVELAGGAFVHFVLRRVGLLIVSAIAGRGCENECAGGRIAQDELAAVVGHMAAFVLGFDDGGEVHAFAGESERTTGVSLPGWPAPAMCLAALPVRRRRLEPMG